jgi:hypothetical protein
VAPVSDYTTRLDQASADRARRRQRQQRINLIVAGVAIWLVGPILLGATVDGYLDGRKFRDAFGTTTATVIDRGSTLRSRLGGGFDRNMLVEFQSGGERRSARVLLPESVRIGTEVEIDYAVADPSVASLTGQRAPLHRSTGVWCVTGTAVALAAAIACHLLLVRRYRRASTSGQRR